MRSKMIAILIISISLSACSSNPTSGVVEILIPPKHYAGTVKLDEITQCPEPVRKSVYKHLRYREQYIETLEEVIKAHNGD